MGYWKEIKDKAEAYKKKKGFWFYFLVIFLAGNAIFIINEGYDKYNIYTFVGSIVVASICPLLYIGIIKIGRYLQNKFKIHDNFPNKEIMLELSSKKENQKK